VSTASDLAGCLPSKTLHADSSSCFVQAEICAGCTPSIWANSAVDLSTFRASSATFALKRGIELVPSGCHEHLQDASVLNLKSVSSFRGPLQTENL
jgi:hypothetical protein